MKIYVVPWPHYDPWWEFEPEVAERLGANNIRKALDIMGENSEFKYAIDQVFLLDVFKKYFPKRVEELKRRVKEGRIELVCGGYVNPDLNLPSGESLIRQMSFCQRVWKKEFGVKSESAGIMDSFGQSAQLPQIFSKLGIKYHTAKRGASRELPAVFLWEGVDGSQIIFDRQPRGHHGITAFPPFFRIFSRENPSEKLEKIIRKTPGVRFLAALIALYLPDFTLWATTKGKVWRFKTALKYLSKVYPNSMVFIPHSFGADGAMPFEWIVFLCKTYSRLSKDEMFISSPSEFFKSLENIRDELPVVGGELNGPTEKDGEPAGALPATCSTRIRVKQQARQSERLLYLVEILETMRYLTWGEYRDLTELWKLKLSTDFHDGICGSLTDDNYNVLQEKARQLQEECQKIIQADLKSLSFPESVFNPLPWSRKDLIERNRKLELAEAGPAGFSPIKILKPKGIYGFNKETEVLFSPFYKVTWEDNDLKIYELVPKEGGGMKAGKKLTGGNFARFRLQKENGDAYFWDVSDSRWDRVESIKVIECNDFRSILETKSGVGGLEILQQIIFYRHNPRIDFKVKLNNQEKDIRLQAHLALAEKPRDITWEIPAGFLKDGKSRGQAKWQELFGQKFAYYDNIKCIQNWVFFHLKNVYSVPSFAASKNPNSPIRLEKIENGIAIFNDGLPEHEFVENSCFITLLRCIGRVGTEGRGIRKKFKPGNVPWRAGAPHRIPLAQEQGEHEFRYALLPCQREDVARYAYEFLFPLMFCQGESENKKFYSGPVKELFSVFDKNVIPLAVKKAEEENAIVIRLLEAEKKDRNVEIKFSSGVEFRTAKLTNLMEEEISNLVIKDNAVRIHFKPQEIVSLLLKK